MADQVAPGTVAAVLAQPFRMMVEEGKIREFARATRSRSAEHLRPRDPVPPVTFLARNHEERETTREDQGSAPREPGTRSGWRIEEIELDPPKEREALIRLAASGLCHSDDHLDTGDMQIPFAPLLGGHEGAGIVEQVGPGVTGVSPGDHVALAFMPACGTGIPCVSGTQNLCDVGAGVLAGKAPDGTHRIHARGKGVGAMSFLGTFSPYRVAPIDAVIKIDPAIPLDLAALVGCGVPTGWGSAVYAAETRIGNTVVVAGVGGVGMNAVQGARHAARADRRGRPGRVEAGEGEGIRGHARGGQPRGSRRTGR